MPTPAVIVSSQDAFVGISIGLLILCEGDPVNYLYTFLLL